MAQSRDLQRLLDRGSELQRLITEHLEKLHPRTLPKQQQQKKKRTPPR